MAICVLWLAAPVQGAPRSGEGVCVSKTGKVTARAPSGPVHEGRYETRDLFQGLPVGEQTQITTGNDGHLCMVLTPGALIHVPPNSEVTLNLLRLTSSGLPKSEEDLVRRIEIEVTRGGLYVNGGVPTPSLEIDVKTKSGQVDANGGIFSVVHEDAKDSWGVSCQEYEVNLKPNDGEAAQLKAGDSAALTPRAVLREPGAVDPGKHEFKLCSGYFQDLESFRHPASGFDTQGVENYLGTPELPTLLGNAGSVTDVSPSFRAPSTVNSTPVTPQAIGAPDGKRWTEERIWEWWDNVGVIRGANYIPRNCVNSVEMWMEETFDTDVIDEELGWAKSIGYTSVRIPLQEAAWRHDPEAFVDMVEKFLDLAEKHGLTVVPVLFDDANLAGSEPRFGPQPDPIPGVNNGRWVPSPGPSGVTDPNRWPDLEKYVRDVVGKFKKDDRVLYWDLYNTAGNDGLWEQTLPLMDQVFNWVRDVDPRQPLAVAAWKALANPMTAHGLERSDLITFQSFDNAETMEAKITLLQRNKRPMIASDWLMRQKGNTFEEALPIFSSHNVGWFNRGLVQGRTQTWIQSQDSKKEDAPDVWQHDVLKPDGTPYDEKEVELIRGFKYAEGR